MDQVITNFNKVFSGPNMKVPAEVGEMVAANLDQARAAYEKAAENIKSYGEAAHTALIKQQAVTRELSNRVLENTNANVGAALDVAQKLARSSSVQEALKIQTDFVQTQTKRIVEQTNETFSLAMKASQEAFAAWSSALPGRVS